MEISKNPKEKIKVLYLMGSGRSGSTLLNIILDNHPELAGLGELNNISRLSQENFNCSCLKRVADCDFWSEVLDEWKRQAGPLAVKWYIAKLPVVEKVKSPVAWFKMLLNYPGQSTYLSEYQRSTYNYYKSIQNISGKPIIVDISKNPLRALLLHRNPNIDLLLIHLVRDGRGVAWSQHKFVKAEVKQWTILRTALFWVVVNRLSNFVRHKVPGTRLIRYEDFVAFPEKISRDICSIAEIDPQPIVNIINGDVATASHVMAGNKLRRQKSIKIRLDTEWHEKLDVEKQKEFLRITHRTMASYGYITKPKSI